MSTVPELHLSPALRAAERAVATWLERSGADARRAAFAARAALGQLDRTDYVRLTRWLAWTCLASSSQGIQAALARMQRLDPRLGARIADEVERLPALSDGAFAQTFMRSA